MFNQTPQKRNQERQLRSMANLNFSSPFAVIFLSNIPQHTNVKVPAHLGTSMKKVKGGHFRVLQFDGVIVCRSPRSTHSNDGTGLHFLLELWSRESMIQCLDKTCLLDLS